MSADPIIENGMTLKLLLWLVGQGEGTCLFPNPDHMILFG